MSKTNQVCITCTQRDSCQYYDPNRTLCVPVMTEQEMQFELMKSIEKANELRQEVSSMNKEREFWQQVHIQAAIAAMQGMVISDAYCSEEPVGPAYQIKRRKWAPARIAQEAVAYADFLIAELQNKGGKNETAK